MPTRKSSRRSKSRTIRRRSFRATDGTQRVHTLIEEITQDFHEHTRNMIREQGVTPVRSNNMVHTVLMEHAGAIRDTQESLYELLRPEHGIEEVKLVLNHMIRLKNEETVMKMVPRWG